MKQWILTGLRFSLVYQSILLLTIGVFLVINQPTLSIEKLRSLFGAWDGDHYVYLAKHGYVTQGDPANFVVFFPLYPLLIRAVAAPLFGSYYLSAFLVTTTMSIVGHTFFYVVLRQIGLTARHAFYSLLLLFASPISVYFSHLYTESLFLATTSVSLYFLYQKNFLYSGILGGLASMSRLVGVLTAVPFILHVWERGTLRKSWKPLVGSALIPLGLAVYLGINLVVYNDPFHYQTILKRHWYKEPVNPITQVINHTKQLLSGPPEITTMTLDTIATLAFPFIFIFYVAFWIFKKRTENRELLPMSWIVWAGITWIVIASQSFWLSNLRYVALILPLYPMLVQLTAKYRLLYWILVGVFAVLALQSVHLFTVGEWVY